MPTEFDFISWIQSQQQPSQHIRLGIGDDLAILDWKKDDLLLLGVDQVLDGVHFDSTVHPPGLIGRKAMNRNLSDCAAMGCVPTAALVTIVLPKGTGEAYAKELFLGIKHAGDAFDVPIVGGDTSTWTGKLMASVTILGNSGGTKPLTRGGAKAGDAIYVTGPLGGSILGRHMTFEPRMAQGRQLAASGRVNSMIDLSDGLSRDLGHICKTSGVGALLFADAIPVHEDAVRLSLDGRSPLEHAMNDGEDFELLFTGEPGLDYPCIGQITREAGIRLKQGESIQQVQPGAWEHTF